MSVIAISFSPHLVRIAADSYLTGETQMGGACKVETMECGTLVGVTGTPLWHTFVRRYEGEPTDRFSVEEMALAWVAWARKVGTALVDGGPIGELLVITPSAEVFEVCNDGAAIPIDKPLAIGSGAQIAMGALHTGVTAARAVRAAIDLDPFCGGEIQRWGVPRLQPGDVPRPSPGGQ